ARAPWVLDVPLTPSVDGLWTNKKAPGQSMPLDEATWVADDGLRYLNPEIVLFMKAAQTRSQDVQDAATALPLLDARRRAWLRDTIARVAPSPRGRAWTDPFGRRRQTSVSPRWPSGPHPGRIAKIALPVCWMNRLRASCSASRRWAATNWWSGLLP